MDFEKEFDYEVAKALWKMENGNEYYIPNRFYNDWIKLKFISDSLVFVRHYTELFNAIAVHEARAKRDISQMGEKEVESILHNSFPLGWERDKMRNLLRTYLDWCSYHKIGLDGERGA